jgi:hypothetical protein
VPVPRGVDRDGRDVPVVAGEHEARVADDDAVDARDVVGARAAQRELAHEQADGPRPRIHLGLDAQHGAQVPPPHRNELHRELVVADVVTSVALRH